VGVFTSLAPALSVDEAVGDKILPSNSVTSLTSSCMDSKSQKAVIESSVWDDCDPVGTAGGGTDGGG